MNEPTLAQWEQAVQETAATFTYPPTPDVTGAVVQRLRWQPALRPARPLASQPRLAWALVLAVLLIGGLMAVPQVRAAVLQVLRVGAVTIFVAESTPTPTALSTAVPATAQPGLAVTLPATAAPAASPTPATLTGSLPNLAGAVTLAEAQAQVGFPLRLPTYPPDLGPPDRVFHQDRLNALVVLLWLEPDRPQEIRLALYLVEGEDFGIKKEVGLVQETTVNGATAIWVEGPHMLQLRDGRLEPWYFIEGNVLIWFDGRVTYRLESGLSLAEAVRIAESLEIAP